MMSIIFFRCNLALTMVYYLFIFLSIVLYCTILFVYYKLKKLKWLIAGFT